MPSKPKATSEAGGESQSDQRDRPGGSCRTRSNRNPAAQVRVPPISTSLPGGMTFSTLQALSADTSSWPAWALPLMAHAALRVFVVELLLRQQRESAHGVPSESRGNVNVQPDRSMDRSRANNRAQQQVEDSGEASTTGSRQIERKASGDFARRSKVAKPSHTERRGWGGDRSDQLLFRIPGLRLDSRFDTRWEALPRTLFDLQEEEGKALL
ncbi:hypothetical protein BV20DRAFT_978199 [Pilatotrama ljubarskyi]|nr:hypothetical protein BV20DRAFT_978199 [Pilatotrama ljubarskyi]